MLPAKTLTTNNMTEKRVNLFINGTRFAVESPDAVLPFSILPSSSELSPFKNSPFYLVPLIIPHKKQISLFFFIFSKITEFLRKTANLPEK